MKRKQHNDKVRRRKRRAFSIRKNCVGSAERPRLAIFRSAKHIYAQLIDDGSGKTLAATSTLSSAVREALSGPQKTDAATAVGKKLAEKATAAGVEAVVFDRAGYPYHGRIAALAKGAREGGLRF